MPDKTPGLIEVLNNLIGGGLTALIAALVGRMMFHAGEVRAKRRPVVSWALVWEVPLAVGMALIGEGLGEYLGLPRTQTTALIAVLSYLGPRGVGVMFERWMAAKQP